MNLAAPRLASDMFDVKDGILRVVDFYSSLQSVVLSKNSGLVSSDDRRRPDFFRKSIANFKRAANWNFLQEWRLPGRHAFKPPQLRIRVIVDLEA